MPAMMNVESGGSNARINPQSLLDKASGSTDQQYNIARNLTALTPLADDAKTISKTNGSAKDVLQSIVDIKTHMLSPQGDPAGYVMTHNSLLSGAQQEALSKPNDKLSAGNPTNPTFASGETNMSYYIKTLDGVYNSLNQPLNNRPVISQEVGQKIVSNIVSGGMGGAQKNFDTMQQQYGDNYQRVYNDLVRYGLPARFQIMSNITDPQMQSRLASAYNNPDQVGTQQKADKFWEGALGGKGKDAPKQQIDSAIDSQDSAINTYFSTLKASGARDSDISAYREVVKRLAYEGKMNGEDAKTAADNAMNALTGKYQYYEKARIPSDVATVVQRNAESYRANVSSDDLTIPSYASSPDNYIHSVKYAGQYITNIDETGLNIRDQSGRLVRGKDGNPVTIPFSAKNSPVLAHPPIPDESLPAAME